MYKISIILPVYNVETYLNSCLSSLIKQTIGFENLEIIFVDDHSIDNSYNIIKNFSKEYDNVKVFQTPYNSGSAGKPRNIGLQNATSQYIMFLDPDDTYFENACEILYANAINSNADLVSGNYLEYTSGKMTKPMDYKRSLNIKGNYLEINSLKECPELLTLIPALWVKIYKKELLLNHNIRFIDYTIAEDLLFVVQCLIKSEKTVFIDVPIVKYIIRQNEEKSKSITATKNTKNLFGYIHVYNKLYNLIKDYDEKLAWMASIHLYFGTREMILSHANKIDKQAFLHTSKSLYIPFIEHYPPQKGFETITKLISEQKFMQTINVSELMEQNLTNDKNLLKKIKNKEVIILYNSSNSKETLFKLINSLYQNKINISVIDIDYNNTTNIIDNTTHIYNEEYSNQYINSMKAYKKFLFKKQIKFINIFEYNIFSSTFKEKTVPRIHNTDLKENLYIKNNYIIIKEYSLDKIRKYNFYNLNEFTPEEIDKLKNSAQNTRKLNQIVSSKKMVKSKKIDGNNLLIKSIFNQEFNEEYVYTTDENEYLTLHHDNNRKNNTITIFDNFEEYKLVFNSKEEFIQYFLLQYCIKFENKPFIINLTPNKNITRIISNLTHNIEDYDNYESSNWLNILKESYTNSKINELELISNKKIYENDYINHKTKLDANKKDLAQQDNELIIKTNLIKQLDEETQKQQETIQEQNNTLINEKNKIKKINEETQKQQKTIQEQNNTLINEKNKIKKINEETQKQQETIEQQNITIDKNSSKLNQIAPYLSQKKFSTEKNETLRNLETTNDYYKLKSNPKKMLTSILPYFYILYKHKNIIENIKFYRKITKSNWLNIGYYLNSNPDIKRKKWCKILTPETHYTCHGFDEKRLPYPNYKNNQTKKEIISSK